MKTYLVAGAVLFAMTLSASAEMPKPQFGIKVSNPSPTPRTTGGTAALNNQTFTVPSSVLRQNATSPSKVGAFRVIRTSVPKAAEASPSLQNNTATLNNQTFSVPKSVVVSPADARRMKVLSILSHSRGATPQPNANGIPTSIVVPGKAEPSPVGVVSGRRLPNAPAKRCPGGAWTC